MDHGTGEKKAQSPKGEASTAQNSSSPKSIMNHVKVGGTLKNTQTPVLKVGGTLKNTQPPVFKVGGTLISRCKNPENFDQTSVVADGVCSATGATGATGATSDTGATGATSTTGAQEGDGVERPSALCATDSNTEQESKVTFAGALPGNGKGAQASNCWAEYFDADQERMVNDQTCENLILVSRPSVPLEAKLMRTKWGCDGKDEDVFLGHTASGGWCTVETHGDDWFPKQVNVKNQGPVKWVLKILMERNKGGVGEDFRSDE